MYNFTIPSQLRAWIDRILVAGKTFKYGAQGVEGLAAKRVIVAISRGDITARHRPPSANIWNLFAVGVRLYRRDRSGIHFRGWDPGQPRTPRESGRQRLMAAGNLNAA
jgi:FMN-dependent NADH-azoreductase